MLISVPGIDSMMWDPIPVLKKFPTTPLQYRHVVHPKPYFPQLVGVHILTGTSNSYSSSLIPKGKGETKNLIFHITSLSHTQREKDTKNNNTELHLENKVTEEVTSGHPHLHNWYISALNSDSKCRDVLLEIHECLFAMDYSIPFKKFQRVKCLLPAVCCILEIMSLNY